MNPIDYILILVIGVAFIKAITSIRKNKGKCCGNCSGCGQNCQCNHKA